MPGGWGGVQQIEQRWVSVWPHTTALKWLKWKRLHWEQLKNSLRVENEKFALHQQGPHPAIASVGFHLVN